VIGADGRRSTLARLVGAASPYRSDRNGRGQVFAYVEDPEPAENRTLLYQWRVGDTLGNYFPTGEGSAIVLFMGPAEDVARFGPDLEHWNRMIEANPHLRERIGSGRLLTRLRKSTDTVSYFRRSTGPGWALAGDAGHFKDPAVAQGIRDAVHHGRRLGRAAAAELDDPQRLDRAARRWEYERDRDCLPTYYWGLRLTRTHPATAVETEAFRTLEASPAVGDELADVFARSRRPRQLTSLPRLVRWSVRALRRPGSDRRALTAEVRSEMALTVAEWWDGIRLRAGRRVRPRPGDHPDPGAAAGSR
jgi:flavin-dependent dehydrogenase